VATKQKATWAPNSSGAAVLYGLKGREEGYFCVFPAVRDELIGVYNANVDLSEKTAIGTPKPKYPESARGTWDMIGRDEKGTPEVQLYLNGKSYGPVAKLRENFLDAGKPEPEFEFEIDD